MAKTLNKAVTLAEEAAAALLEKIRPSKKISPTGMKKVQRVHELKEMIAELDAEIETIKVDIYKEMDRKGVDVLDNGKGVEVVSRDPQTRTKVDRDGLAAEFPEIAAQFIIESPSTYRVNWKKLTHF